MRIHKYILLSIMTLTTLVACEPNHLEDNLLDSVVYFSRSGVNSVLFYDAEEIYDYSFYAVNAGYYKGETKVSITKDASIIDKYNQENETSLKELPADCYTILEDDGQITKDKSTCTFKIRFDCDKLRSLSQVSDYSDLADYVVPMVLTSDGDIAASDKLNTLLLHPDMKQISVAAVTSGEVTVQKSDINGTLVYEFPVKTSTDNKWETVFNILSGENATQYINSSLLKRGTLSAYSALVPTPSDAYTIDFDNTINPGTSIATMTVTVDATKIPAGCSSIALYLEGATVAGSMAPVAGTPYFIIHFQNVEPMSIAGLIDISSNTAGKDATYLGKYLTTLGYTVIPRTGWVFSPDSYQANSYPNAIDGNTSSHWENRYNDNSGSVGPKSSLPFNAILDLGSVQSFSAIELWRRMNATYVKDLRGYELYVSDDKMNWKYVTTIDYGTGAEQRAMYNAIAKVSGRYVNFYITKSNRSANVSIAELFLWNK